jgi:arginyl-tRNA synthetase
LGNDYQIPVEGYKGKYIEKISEDVIKKLNINNLKDISSNYEKIKKISLEMTLDSIKNDLEMLGIEYDNWFSENSLISEETLQVCLEILEKKNLLYEKDGAKWFKSSLFQTDGDVVLYKSNDEGHTYFATDIAYHYNKFFIRKYERIINIFGADHHSHVFRIKSALEAFEIDQNKMDTLLTQIVHFKSNNKSERFSKRAGNIYTIRDLLNVVGVDAIRFNFLHRTPESQQEFDIDLAIKESSENPVYYIQYAYARLSSIINSVKFDCSNANFNLLKTKFETNLIETLDLFPDVVSRSTSTLQTHLITKYSLDLARQLQIFYENCRVLSEDIELTKARVNLVISSKIVLKNVLNLLGINTPERM